MMDVETIYIMKKAIFFPLMLQTIVIKTKILTEYIMISCITFQE